MIDLAPRRGSARGALALVASTAAMALWATAPASAQDAGGGSAPVSQNPPLNPAPASSSEAPAVTPTNPSATTDASASRVQEVVVTGSRIGRSTFTTTNPVTVIGEQEIEKLNLTNVGSVIAELPQNSNFFAGNNVGLGNFNVGAQLVNLRGLNPFFGTRTLTLLDTQRVVPTTTGGGVDITLIPSLLVGRVDTETGGASAVYGSDAIAGVVNIILDTKLEGFKSVADFSQTTYGDGDDYHAGAAYGHGFAGGRGHFIVGGEFEDSASIGLCDRVRPWCSTNYTQFTNGDYATPGAPGYGLPHYILGYNGVSALNTTTGLLFGAGPPVQFNATGSALAAYTPGPYPTAFGYQQGGGPNTVGAYDTTTMRPDVKRYSFLAHADYDITNSITGSVEGLFARSLAVNPVANGAIGPFVVPVVLPFGTIYVGNTISADNAYLPPDAAAYVAATPTGTAAFGKNMLDAVEARNQTANNTFRFVGSLKGQLPGTWRWDAYGEYGENENAQHLFHNAVSSYLGYALDAVRDPATGNVVCRATLAGNPDAAGCQPLNLFGVGNASQAALDYAFQTLQEYSTYKQAVVSGNLTGQLYQGWGAGPIGAAFGAEYRHEHGDVTHDLQDQPFYEDYTLSYGLDYAGSTDVEEAYGEVSIPVLKDLAFTKYLEVDGAFRETYNTAHNETTEPPGFAPNPQAGQSRSRSFDTWKVNFIWDVTDWFRLRGTRSRDVRAAQFRELFETYAVTAGGPFGSVNNPYHGNASEPTTINSGGSLNLKPEEADTTTIGGVFSPKSGWLNRLRLSADWYEIVVNDPIAGPPGFLGAQNIVNQCFAGATAFCALETRDANNDITSVTNFAINLGKFTTRGVDLEGDYSLPLDTVHLPGTLSFRVLASYLYDMIIDTGLGGSPVNYAGQSGPTAAFGGFNTSPKWQANAFFTYATGPFTGILQLRYIGPGTFETLSPFGGLAVAPGDPGYSTTNPNSVSDNHVASAVYVNLSGTYDVTRNVELFSSINNVLNKYPPKAPGGNGYPTNPVYFDTYGMTWKVGARLRF